MSELSPELRKIKKVYGEKFMKYCREYFSTILEKEGRLLEILEKSFSKNCTLSDDINTDELKEQLKDYIYSKIDVEDEEKRTIEEKTPYKLLEEAEYSLYECKTEEEIQKFKKYYAKGEELCTFNGGRLNRCVVFWAIKKDADKIKREDFDKPAREDEYGTSVMGIQFAKTGVSTVSIKNRYNHTVNNPDATYGNNLDRIIPGLTQSFKKLLLERGLNLNDANKEQFCIPCYTVANDGRYYKYNIEINGVYYCPGNIIIDNGQVNKLEPEKQELIDYFILDKENKTIQLYDKNIKDSFADILDDIKKIEIKKDKEKGIKTIEVQEADQDNPVIIKVNKDNQIIGYKNEKLTKTGNCFLYYNSCLTELEMPNAVEIGNGFLFGNEYLTELKMSNAEKVGDDFLYWNRYLTELEMPRAEKVGDNFLCCNRCLTELEMPNAVEIGNNFLQDNENLTKLEMPRAEKVGDDFLYSNRCLTELEMPNAVEIGNGFLFGNEYLTELKMSNAEKVGYNFLCWNRCLTELEMPRAEKVGDNFLFRNRCLTELKMPNAVKIGSGFLHGNKSLAKLEMPNAVEIGNCFLFSNEYLTELKMPNLVKTGAQFLSNNKELRTFKTPNMPKLEKSFSKIIHKNKEKIKSEDIVKLDKDSKITTYEENAAMKIIEKLKNKEKNVLKANNENERN